MQIRNGGKERGFSLIELSVAATIYAMGLGSMSLMLLLAIQGTAGARYDTLAAMHADSLAETIAMSSDAVGHYIHPPGTETCLPGQACALEALAAHNMAVWQAGLERDLPHGGGTVCRDATPDDGDAVDAACDGGGGPVVKVFWQTPGDDAQAARSHRQVTTLPLP